MSEARDAFVRSRVTAGFVYYRAANCLSQDEKDALLEVKGVGPTVIKRFEEIGLDSFKELKKHQAADIAEMVASMLNTTCWKNSPQSLNAIDAAIQRAREGHQQR